MGSGPVRSGGESRRRRSAGALESEILAAVWAAGHPVTAGEVNAELACGLSYKTVATVLARLADKGLLVRSPAGRAHAYGPVKSEAELFAEQMSAVVAQGRDRSAVLQHFVDRLDPADEAILRAALGERNGRRGV